MFVNRAPTKEQDAFYSCLGRDQLDALDIARHFRQLDRRHISLRQCDLLRVTGEERIFSPARYFKYTASLRSQLLVYLISPNDVITGRCTSPGYFSDH